MGDHIDGDPPEQPRTAEQIAARMPRDPETIEHCKEILLCAGVKTDDMADDEIIERTARVIVVILDFCRKMRPVLREVGAALQRVNIVFHEAEQRSPAFAAYMAVERQRMQIER